MSKRSVTLPLYLIGMMMVIIFLAEATIMLGFFLLGESQSFFSGVADAAILSLLIAFPMYWLIFRPMTQQQQRLYQNQHWLRSITDNLPDALIEIDRQGIITGFNPTAEVMFGYTAAEAIGRSVNMLMPDSEERDHDAFVQLYLETGDSHVPNSVREIAAKRRNGTTFPIAIQVREIRHDGKISFIGLIRDLTQQKQDLQRRTQMQERIERTQRLESLGVLAGGIAHDFNNILAAIMGNTELLEMKVGKEHPEYQECLGNIESGCGRAAELCRQMLAYAGRGQYQLEYIDLNVLLHDMEPLIRVSVPATIRVDKYRAESLPTIRADKSQMEQVILNLITNSAEAIGDKEGGRIVITTRLIHASPADLKGLEHDEELKPGPYVLLQIRDNDSGISPENMERLFEPFFTTKFTGRGLGMSAVLGIINAHEGGIGVESHPGSGTTVRVLLPVQQKQNEQLQQIARSEPFDIAWTGSGTVLVVDDESQLREMVCKMLMHLGFETIEAKNGEQGLEMAARHREEIAAIVLDLTMPVMGGEQAFLHLRSRYPELPVLIASGYGEEKLRELFGDNGPEGFVSKPFRYGDLRRMLYRIARVPPGAESST